MKRSALFPILCYMFYVTCFTLFSCDSPGVDEPALDEPFGKSDGKFDENVFQREVDEALEQIPAMRFQESFVPISEIWENINYSGVEFGPFFYAVCPQARRTESPSELSCSYASETDFRKIKILRGQNETTVRIEKFGAAGFFISALWKFQQTENGFFLTKLEKICRDNAWQYSDVSIKYSKLPDGKIIILADGKIGSRASFSFKTGALEFVDCQNVPAGTIYLYGENDATLYFYGYSSYGCKNCAFVKIGDYYGGFTFCGQWTLRDLFDYLAPYL